MAQHILRFPVVQSLSGDPRSTIYRRVKEGLWTRPVKIGRRSVGWPESEVAALNSARIAGKSEEEIRSLVKKLEADRELRGADAA